MFEIFIVQTSVWPKPRPAGRRERVIHHVTRVFRFFSTDFSMVPGKTAYTMWSSNVCLSGTVSTDFITNPSRFPAFFDRVNEQSDDRSCRGTRVRTRNAVEAKRALCVGTRVDVAAELRVGRVADRTRNPCDRMNRATTGRYRCTHSRICRPLSSLNPRLNTSRTVAVRAQPHKPDENRQRTWSITRIFQLPVL